MVVANNNLQLLKLLLGEGWALYRPQWGIIDYLAFKENYPIMFIKCDFGKSKPAPKERKVLKRINSCFNGKAYFVGELKSLEYHLEILNKQYGEG